MARIAITLLTLAWLAAPARAQDRDADHVLDAVDLCPDVREGAGTLFPGDGCPDTDGDHDRVVDDYDACPREPETMNGFRDLDGCPDVPGEMGVPRSDPSARVGCLEGAGLVDVARSASGAARLVPRADAPTWLGTTTLDCYAGVAFDARYAIHCATPSGAVEATLALRVDGTHAIGVLAIRSVHGLDHRAWSGTAVPAFDRRVVLDMVAAHQDDFAACSEHEVETTPSLSGHLVVRLTVQTSGEVDGVAITSDTLTPARPAIGACIVAIVDAWTITPPPRCAPSTSTFQIGFAPEPPAQSDPR